MTRLVVRIYRVLLSCYPPEFRAEFGDEMQNVFSSSVLGAAQKSWLSLIRCFWHEAKDWPASVVREHWRTRRTKMSESSDPLPIKTNELWAASAIFLIPALAALLVEIVSIEKMPNWAGQFLVVIFLGSAIIPLIWGIVLGFPRWSPPYLGALLVGYVFFGPFWRVVELFYPALIRWIGPMSTWSLPVLIFYQGLLSAIIWLLVLLAAMVLVSLLRLWPHTRSLWQHVREDWTQLSFILYGGLVFHIVMIFDEYQSDGPWMIAAWLCLGIGCWFYLRGRKQKQRLLILLTGATLAMWIVAIGKWVIVPSQNWGGGFARLPATDTDRWFETGRTMIDWLCLMAALLIPSLLNLFPQKHKTMPNADPSLARGS